MFSHPLRYGCICLLLVAALCPRSGQAQFSDAPPRRPFRTGQTTNLFATWKGRAALDGLVVELPSGWTLDQAQALQYGYEPVTLDARSNGASRYVLTAPETLRDPFDLILRVQTGASPGSFRWTATPFSWQTDRRRQRVTKATYRLDRRLRTRALPQATPSNHALSFSGDQSLQLQRRALPPLGDQDAYTVAFWMRTHALGAVVLSTWSGEERQPYPLEGVVGADGRFRVYQGQRGSHESLATKRPVADGKWHHLAITHDPMRHRMTLHLDGAAVDSLRPSALPPLPSTPLVLGKRPAGPAPADSSLKAYTGLIDELMVTPGAMSSSMLRPLLQQAPPSSENAVTLSFEDEEPSSSVFVGRSPTPERVPVRRETTPPVTKLRAGTRGQVVELTWQARRRAGSSTFYIERSMDGRTFETVGRRSSSETASGQGAMRFRFDDLQTPDEDILFYRIRRVTDENEEVSRTLKVGRGPSPNERVLLMGNSPNPFSSATTIAYRVEQRQRVRLSVWDLSGHRVAMLVNRVQPVGSYEVTFQSRQLSSGTYFARLQTPTRTESLKMALVR